MRKLNLLVFLTLILLASCRFMGKRIRGNGVIKTEERSVNGTQGSGSQRGM